MTTALDRKLYRKIAGAHINGITPTAGRYFLYAGPDHFLQVRKLTYFESYRRFYFSDIQAITLSRTNSGLFMTCIHTFLACYFALLAVAGYVLPDFEMLMYVGGIGCGLFVLILLVHVALGPTCKGHIYTAVQREPLQALTRVRRAQRALALMNEAIEQAQGPLPSGDAEAESERLLTLAKHRKAGDSAGARRASSDEVRIVMTVFFWLLIFDALLALTGALNETIWGVSWILYGLTCICILVMEARHVRIALTRRLTNLALAGTLCLLGALLTDLTLQILSTFTQTEPLRFVRLGSALGFGIALLIISSLGLSVFRRPKAGTLADMASPEPPRPDAATEQP